MVEPRTEPPTQQQPPFAWARLNADTVLLGLLAITGGVFDITNPAHDVTVQVLGHATPAYYLRASIYVVSGLLILYALARQHTAEEVLGRLILIAGMMIQTVRTGLAVGWTAPITYERYALLLVVGFVCWLRLTALLTRRGLTVTLPPRHQ